MQNKKVQLFNYLYKNFNKTVYQKIVEQKIVEGQTDKVSYRADVHWPVKKREIIWNYYKKENYETYIKIIYIFTAKSTERRTQKIVAIL